MSYKIDLSDLERDGASSLTQQLVDRFAGAIEGGELAPGEKLPPTRALALEARLQGDSRLLRSRRSRRLSRRLSALPFRYRRDLCRQNEHAQANE